MMAYLCMAACNIAITEDTNASLGLSLQFMQTILELVAVNTKPQHVSAQIPSFMYTGGAQTFSTHAFL